MAFKVCLTSQSTQMSHVHFYMKSTRSFHQIVKRVGEKKSLISGILFKYPQYFLKRIATSLKIACLAVLQRYCVTKFAV